MKIVRVELGDRSYEIAIASGILEEVPRRLTELDPQAKVFLASDPIVYDLYGQSLEQRLVEAGIDAVHLLIPEGEKHKTLKTVEKLYTYLIAERADRHSTVVALGGGVTGDTAGFVAATYLRGIKFVQIPTTLLAQVDSSVGGKTGVNHQLGKNLIGAFHQPALVLVDVNTLVSLPDRQYQSGLYEVAKYGLIHDSDFFGFFGDHLDAVKNREGQALERVIGRCCEIKAAVISVDEREHGLRQILNFGHTLGHAVEAALDYQGITHGEAIGYGMLAALRLSESMGLLSSSEAAQASSVLLAIGSLPDVSEVPFQRLSDAMAHDKKRRGSQNHFVLLTRIGATQIHENPDPALVAEAWQAAVALGQGSSR